MKMNKSAKKLIIVLMSLTVCLAGLAVGYGHWQDSLNINATTYAAVSGPCLGFVQVTTDDQGPPLQNAPPDGLRDHTIVSPIALNLPTYQLMNKDVGWTNAWTEDPMLECGDAWDVITVEVHNAYPSYSSATTITMQNVGTYNVIIDTTSTSPLDPAPLPEELVAPPGWHFAYYQFDQHTKCGFLFPGDDPVPGETWEEDAVLDVCWFNFEGEQLVPGQATAAELKLHVLQPAEQDAVYNFGVLIRAMAE
jgi:hypothetical protein